MGRRAVKADERQPLLFNAPEIRVWRSDERALSDMRDMVETLEAGQGPPVERTATRGQQRRFEVLAQRVTPLEAAALRARFAAELERLKAAEL